MSTIINQAAVAAAINTMHKEQTKKGKDGGCDSDKEEKPKADKTEKQGGCCGGKK